MRLRILTIVTMVAGTMLAPATIVPDGMFANAAVLLDDDSHVVFVPGERWCPEIDLPEVDPTRVGMCLVDFVEGVGPASPWRLDWNEAFRKCLSAGYTDAECEESVRDGEF